MIAIFFFFFLVLVQLIQSSEGIWNKLLFKRYSSSLPSIAKTTKIATEDGWMINAMIKET